MIAFSNSVVAIDIETISSYNDIDKLPKHIEEYVNKSVDKRLKDKSKIDENVKKILNNFALDPYVGEILMIGTATVDQKIILVNKKLLNRDIDENLIDNVSLYYYENEKAMLEDFNESINNLLANSGVIVSFNGKEFDLPYIFIRSVINKVETPLMNYIDLINKYNYSYHIDLHNLLDGSLRNIMLAFNINSDDISGADIGKLYTEGKYEEIIDKNLKDLIGTTQLFDNIVPWISHKIKATF